MNRWEQELLKLTAPSVAVPKNYEIKPGKSGPVIYCSDCAITIACQSSNLNEIVDEAMKHELSNHH